MIIELVVLVLTAVALLAYTGRARRVPGVVAPFQFRPVLGHFLDAMPYRTEVLTLGMNMKEKGLHQWTLSMPFSPPFIFTDSVEDVEHVLSKNFLNYEKGARFHSNMFELLGHGIFNTDGALWKKQRKTASHLFKQRTLSHQMTTVFVHHGHKALNILGGLKPEDNIDMANLFFRFTLDSIGEIAFGESIGCLDTPKPVAFADLFDRAQATLNERSFKPFWRVTRFFYEDEREMPERVKLIKKFARDVIGRRRADLLKRIADKEANGGVSAGLTRTGSGDSIANSSLAALSDYADGEDLGDREDLLTMFLQMRDENGKPYDEDFLVDAILNFTIAGRDTTACALSWLFFELTRHPEVEERIVREINNALAEEQSDFPTFATAQKMKYTEAVIYETVRLYPSVPKNMKQAVADDTLPSGVRVPAGTNVVWMPYVMGRSEHIWENPMRFDPDRFYNKPVPSNFQFISFHAGPRLCLGKPMAILEAKMVIAFLLPRFRFRLAQSLPPTQDLPYKETITLPVDGGLRMKVSPRV